MRTWLLEKKETVRHLREIASVGSPGRPWTANFRSECLCLPVFTDPVALQVDLEELRFLGGTRDFTSVIATLQTMLHDAGYAFLNLVPTWGRTLSPEPLVGQDRQFMYDASFLWGLLTVEQVAWNEIAQGRQYSVRRDDAPFQTLDPEVTSAFLVEEDGDTLMLTPEEHELLGNRSDAVGAPMHRYPCLRGSARMKPLEYGGGSQGSPGLEPSVAMFCVYMATTGTGTGQPYTAEQPTVYVPVAEYPPGQGKRLPPHAPPPTASPIRGDGPGSSEEETKSDAPMTARDPHLPENNRDRDREADRQISELRAALAARDELERIRNEVYRAAWTAQATQAKLSQEAWEYREAKLQERAARETERRKTSDQEFASLQAKVYLLKKERAQDREEGTQLRAEARHAEWKR
ncbi:hypothetical protein PHMEG_00035721 [Phytophthora megakarya]|uniref:Uncharacterized protein n=1 Tax=Phytophthora megakarya TaxID=4795 RepID=A0A225UMQ6_9STRA|nr:hypothetical protein PHMEG_00035721 [Phytophthora megakarya]